MSVEDRIRRGMAANAAAHQPAVETSLDRVRGRARLRRALSVTGAAAAVAAVTTIAVAAWPSPPPADTPAAPDRSPTSALFGRYAADVTTPARLAGHWVLTFHGDGTLAVEPPHGYSGVVSGTLFTADEQTFRTNLFAQDVCADGGNGAVAWARAGQRLVLRGSDDPCVARQHFFTTSEWSVIPQP